MAEAPKTEMLDVSKLTGDGMEVTFIIALPGQPEKRYPMRAATMHVGRSEGMDIAIKDASISSKHLDLVKAGGRLVARDLGSSNGTFFNGQRTQEVELNDGDQLRLGNATTLTVSIVGGSGRRGAAPPAPPAADGAGSTAMISADDLDAMRRPAPAPRRTAAAPPPMMQQPRGRSPQAGPPKGIIVGIAAGVAVTVIGTVVAVVLISKSRAHSADLELIDRVQKELAAVVVSTPCTSVQDSVATLIKMEKDVGVFAPTPPANMKYRPAYQRYVEVERDKARQYKRIAGTVEQMVATTQVTVDRIKSDVQKIGDETLRAKAVELGQGLDDRMQLSQDFISGWRKLQVETDRFADVTEAVFVKGGADPAGYNDFRFSKQAPQVLGSCRQAHDSSRRDLEEKATALKALTAR